MRNAELADPTVPPEAPGDRLSVGVALGDVGGVGKWAWATGWALDDGVALGDEVGTGRRRGTGRRGQSGQVGVGDGVGTGRRRGHWATAWALGDGVGTGHCGPWGFWGREEERRRKEELKIGESRETELSDGVVGVNCELVKCEL
jgi:hypothetical protein